MRNGGMPVALLVVGHQTSWLESPAGLHTNSEGQTAGESDSCVVAKPNKSEDEVVLQYKPCVDVDAILLYGYVQAAYQAVGWDTGQLIEVLWCCVWHWVVHPFRDGPANALCCNHSAVQPDQAAPDHLAGCAPSYMHDPV